MLLINCSNRENNCFNVLNLIKSDNDKLLSLANKQMNFCLGCDKCIDKLDKHCVLNDYITNNVYNEIIKVNDIVIACPIYMSNINGILKNLIDRFNPFYHHNLLKDKNIYLILIGQTSKEENAVEVQSILDYFDSISEWLYFKFVFLEYFQCYNNLNEDVYFNDKIQCIKDRLNKNS